LLGVIAAVQRIECAESLETFAKYVVTKDEHGFGEATVRLFPTREQKPYIWDILDTIQAEQLIAIEKSRQLMVTWLVCLFCLWCAKYQKNRLIFIQSKKEEDAANLVFNAEWPAGRISFMESNLPEQLRSDCASAYGKLFFRDTGSRIWGIPEGGDQIRSYTASVIASDEAAFQPEFEQAWKASNPSIKGGGKMIVVSSARSGAYMRRLLRRA
jgi:phage FluMu gp28-like protein